MALLSFDTLYVLLGLVVGGIVVASSAVLYQYFTFNSCPPGTRPLPSPKGRLPLVGHRNLIKQVTSLIVGTLILQRGLRDSLINWTRELGEIYQLQMGNFRYVVVSSDVAVKVIGVPLVTDNIGSNGSSFGLDFVSQTESHGLRYCLWRETNAFHAIRYHDHPTF